MGKKFHVFPGRRKKKKKKVKNMSNVLKIKTPVNFIFLVQNWGRND